MNIMPIKTRIFRENEGLVPFITEHIKKLEDGSVLAVTSKIIALSEGRTANVANEKDREALIRFESEWVLKSKHVALTMKDGLLMANAGIDDSNAGGQAVVFP